MKTSEYELLTGGDEQLKPNYSVQPLRLPTATAAVSSYRLRSSCYDKQRPGSWCCLVTSQHSCVVTKQQCIIACHHLCVWHKFSFKRTQMISLDRLFISRCCHLILPCDICDILSRTGNKLSSTIYISCGTFNDFKMEWSQNVSIAIATDINIVSSNVICQSKCVQMPREKGNVCTKMYDQTENLFCVSASLCLLHMPSYSSEQMLCWIV